MYMGFMIGDILDMKVGSKATIDRKARRSSERYGNLYTENG
jgi:hypothetical protein